MNNEGTKGYDFSNSNIIDDKELVDILRSEKVQNE